LAWLPPRARAPNPTSQARIEGRFAVMTTRRAKTGAGTRRHRTSPQACSNEVKSWPWTLVCARLWLGREITCTKTSRREGRSTEVWGTTPRRDESGLTGTWPCLGTLGYARARTHTHTSTCRGKPRHKGRNPRTRGTARRSAHGTAARRGVSLGSANKGSARRQATESARRCGLGWPRCGVSTSAARHVGRSWEYSSARHTATRRLALRHENRGKV
jgi:hypothetical protein